MTHATWGFEFNAFSLSQQSPEMLIDCSLESSSLAPSALLEINHWDYPERVLVSGG